MGQEQSSLSDDGLEPEVGPDGVPSESSSGEPLPSPESSPETASGYRVMKVFRGSAAARCGLRAFEDFILGVRGGAVSGDDRALAETLSRFEGCDVELSVYNVIDKALRPVVLRPVKWNGPGLLGAAVRFENVAGATDAVWHVVDVFPDSPADDAGLAPGTDFIVGTPAQAFRAEAEFSKLVSECGANGSAASVMVYSTATGRVVSFSSARGMRDGGCGD